MLDHHPLTALKAIEELDQARAVGNDILFCWVFQNRLDKFLLYSKILNELPLHEEEAIGDLESLRRFGDDIERLKPGIFFSHPFTEELNCFLYSMIQSGNLYGEPQYIEDREQLKVIEVQQGLLEGILFVHLNYLLVLALQLQAIG